MARTFQRAFALVSLAAWLSLAWQVRELIGPRGLLPLVDLLGLIADRGGASWLDFPTLLRWPVLATDGALLAGAIVGAGLAVAALLGFAPRAAVAASTVLYLSYATVGRAFFAFQWDNLLIECGLLAACLPARRSAPAVHLLLRVVLFKIYFESGVAKLLSPIHDWTDGSAMAAYYETSPLPTAFGFFAHHLPVGWHRVESWIVLAFELVGPFAIFGPRRARVGAASAFTLFQVLNVATANYGFFCFLALALQLFLLDDGDVLRAHAALRRLRRRTPHPSLSPLARGEGEDRRAPKGQGEASRSLALPPQGPLSPRERGEGQGEGRPRLRRAGTIIAVAGFLFVSIVGALEQLARIPVDVVSPLTSVASRLRLVNTYHLFASVTRDRVEPEIQILTGGVWQPAHLRHKPGDPSRRPGFVAPHQPRLDFQLWFHGLRFQVNFPEYLVNLQIRLCEAPDAVASLFAAPLPASIDAVRVAYARATFAAPDERRRDGRWWTRQDVGVTPPAPCAK